MRLTRPRAPEANERAGTNEVERREKSERERAKATNEGVILTHGSRQHHTDEIGWKDRLTVCPGRERAEAEKAKHQELRFELGRSIAEVTEEAWREPGGAR